MWGEGRPPGVPLSLRARQAAPGRPPAWAEERHPRVPRVGPGGSRSGPPGRPYAAERRPVVAAAPHRSQPAPLGSRRGASAPNWQPSAKPAEQAACFRGPKPRGRRFEVGPFLAAPAAVCGPWGAPAAPRGGCSPPARIVPCHRRTRQVMPRNKWRRARRRASGWCRPPSAPLGQVFAAAGPSGGSAERIPAVARRPSAASSEQSPRQLGS